MSAPFASKPESIARLTAARLMPAKLRFVGHFRF